MPKVPARCFLLHGILYTQNAANVIFSTRITGVVDRNKPVTFQEEEHAALYGIRYARNPHVQFDEQDEEPKSLLGYLDTDRRKRRKRACQTYRNRPTSRIYRRLKAIADHLPQF